MTGLELCQPFFGRASSGYVGSSEKGESLEGRALNRAFETDPEGTASAVNLQPTDEPYVPGAEELLTLLAEADEATRQRISIGTMVSAFNFLAALPAEIRRPEVILENTGEIGLDWQLRSNQVLSLNVGDGVVGYAALIGDEPIHGRAPFVERVPQTVEFLFSRLFPGSAASD